MEKLNTTLAGVPDNASRAAIVRVLRGVYYSLACAMVSTAGLVITATSGKKLPKTGASDCYGINLGRLFSIAAGTDMPALSGTVTNAKFNVYCFFVKKGLAAGSLTATSMVSAMGTEGATLELVKFPPFPEGYTLIGFIIVNPTGTGNFVGNTTALDDATVVPNAVYVSPVGSFEPSATV